MSGLFEVFKYGEDRIRTIIKDVVVWFVVVEFCNVLENQ
jgi:prophage antirepressor-like protein